MNDVINYTFDKKNKINGKDLGLRVELNVVTDERLSFAVIKEYLEQTFNYEVEQESWIAGSDMLDILVGNVVGTKVFVNDYFVEIPFARSK